MINKQFQQKMTGFTIDGTHLMLYSIILVYLIIISIFSNKYLDLIATLKKKAALYRMNHVNELQLLDHQTNTKRATKILLRNTLLCLIAASIVHLGILEFTFGLTLTLFKITAIMLGSSLIMLFIVFWLKGSGTVNSNQRFPRTGT